MQRYACLASFVLVFIALAGAFDPAVAEQAQGVAHRNLRHLIASKALTVGTAVPVVAPTGGKSITLGHLTITKGAVAAPAPAPEPTPASAPTPEEPRATPAPTGAPTSAPVTLPRGPPVTGNNDIGQALRCQSAFNSLGGRNGVEAALGNVCKEGNAAFNALGCCQATAKFLNSGSVRGCACNNLVYQQLCQEVKVAGLTCESLRPTLVGCGMQC